MQSRRKSMTVEPISVVSTSLTSNPVTSIAAVNLVTSAGASFANVLNDAVDARSDGKASNHKGKAVRLETDESTQVLRPVPSLLQYNSTIDLYVQLDTLLREKSMLIAIV